MSTDNVPASPTGLRRDDILSIVAEEIVAALKAEQPVRIVVVAGEAKADELPPDVAAELMAYTEELAAHTPARWVAFPECKAEELEGGGESS